jgi:hypothetical protein
MPGRPGTLLPDQPRRRAVFPAYPRRLPGTPCQRLLTFDGSTDCRKIRRPYASLVPEETVPTRSYATRILIAGLVDVVAIGGFVMLEEAVTDLTHNDVAGNLTSTSLMISVTAWLAPKVSYRRRDALWWITGIGGAWLFLILAWRLAYLPFKDWPPRDDELSHAVYLREPTYAGVWRDGRTAFRRLPAAS